jgi:alkylresorcinol/alkylpyrone synthase
MHDYLKAYPDHTAALISVELCSLTLQSADLSIANAIASGLFGDGASAVIATGDTKIATERARHAKVLRSKSCFYRDSEDVMGWDIGTDGFKIILNAKVPQFVQEYLPADLDSFLAESGLQRSDISTWVCHPGGPKVLEAMETALGVNRHELELTWQSLEDVGNLSSASVLFVLADTIKYRRGNSGEFGVMIAMGPGFCSELVLFQW